MDESQIPPKATPVHFYEHANRRNVSKPAIVLESHPGGILRLGLYPNGGGSFDVRTAVYHVDDPRLKDDKGAPTNNAVRNGGWDYHPWFRPYKECEPEKEESNSGASAKLSPKKRSAAKK